MSEQLTIATIVTVLILFGAATVYAQKIDKFLDIKYAAKQKAVQDLVKKPEAKPNSKDTRPNKPKII